jgi:hypothetical protein
MDGSRTREPARDRGHALLLVLVAMALAAALAAGVARFGAVLLGAARAQTAADAAALAGADGGERAAARSAGRNGGTLRSFRIVAGEVLVTVRVGGVTRSARAAGGDRAGPDPTPSP